MARQRHLKTRTITPTKLPAPQWDVVDVTRTPDRSDHNDLTVGARGRASRLQRGSEPAANRQLARRSHQECAADPLRIPEVPAAAGAS